VGSGLLSWNKGAPQLKAGYRHNCNIAQARNKGRGLNAGPEQRNWESLTGYLAGSFFTVQNWGSPSVSIMIHQSY